MDGQGSAALALVLGAVPVVYYVWRLVSGKERKFDSFPVDGVFTLGSLARFDGVTGPICVGVCGKVVDVSSSENIQPGEGYGKIWAGRDATWSLATLSLKIEDSNKLDFKLSDFTPEQHKTLSGWYKHFTTKYPTVGKLKEYEGWDFSTIEEEAKSQTPFGAPKTDGSEPAVPQDGVVFAKGDRVTVKDNDGSQKAFEGRAGVLTGLDPAGGGFEVDFDGQVEIIKPTQLVKL